MRRYELMLDPSRRPGRRQPGGHRPHSRQITAGGGQIVKVAPWGRRRLAYPIHRFREGSSTFPFAAPANLLTELEHSLLITEEVIRHLVTRDERPAKPSRREDGDDAEGAEDGEDADLPSDLYEDQDEDDVPERIGEDESEAAPAAID